MAAAMQHRSMLATIKCSNCGDEIDICMVGEHICTDKGSSNVSIEPVAAPPAPTAHIVPRKGSPLQQEILADDDARSRSPSPILDGGLRTSRPKPPPIDASVANSTRKPAEPLTPAESLTAPDISPVSSSSDGRSSPFLEPPQSTVGPQQPPTPHSRPSSANGSRPSSPDLFSSRPPINRTPSSASNLAHRRPRSPLSQTSTVSHEPPAASIAPPPLRVNIPTHTRQPSGSSIVATPVERHRKSPSIDKSKRQSSNGPEEKKILGLFRRKSSRSISKRDVSSPIIGRNDKVPAVPGVPLSALQTNMPPTPLTPGSMTPGFDSVGKSLPSGPAPPRPARPESIVDVVDHMKTHGVSLPSKPTSPNKSPTAPPLPPPPQPRMPQVSIDESRGRPVETKKQSRNSDASVYTTNSANASPERPAQNNAGLPQISEEADSPSSAKDKVPPPSAWQGDRLRASSGSRHAPSESVSSNGSRYGFDERSMSSISSPPTSSASSFQLRDLQDESKSVPSFLSDGSSVSPKIGTSPRTANFSRPRAPTGSSASGSQSAVSSPLIGGVSTALESPSEPATPVEKQPESPVLPPAPQQTLQPPTLQAFSYQRHLPLQKSAPQSFTRPPLPPMPEEPAQNLTVRPNLSRSKSTASRGQCRGCKQEITGRSVKAADGRLTGRWHKECFVCRTCRTPFQTADFYVLRDEPYCSHHYHVLNNSLCRYCHTGIEGRYFEIDGRRRFHTGCFACAECRRPLNGDYFEVGNRFYCEIDAQRFHQRNHHLNPGRRFPERRTTKLMQM